ncbi:hypothetical protein RI367_005304, partial [Sorochytrium milnesiophthora]
MAGLRDMLMMLQDALHGQRQAAAPTPHPYTVPHSVCDSPPATFVQFTQKHKMPRFSGLVQTSAEQSATLDVDTFLFDL